MNFQEFLEVYQKKEVDIYQDIYLKSPMVSVCVQTYQHVDYIKQCLDGILMQQTNFSFEILLGDDASTDGTREICLSYAQEHPDKIRLFLHHRDNNIAINGSPTGRFNFMYNLFSSRGKYIALCEGDDYWTDPLKLQKQVDFLEANDAYGICFHNTKELNQFDVNRNRIIPNTLLDTTFSIYDYVLKNRTSTCSLIYKRSVFMDLPIWFIKLSFADLGLILLVLKNANRKAMVLHDVMSVYRVHENGIHGKFRKDKHSLTKAYFMHLKFINTISKYLLTEKIYHRVILEKKISTYLILIKLFKQQKNYVRMILYKILCKYYKVLRKLN